MAEIGELIRDIAGKAPVTFRVGTVTDIDKNNDVCTVQPLNGEADRLDVVLRAVKDGADNGYILYPAKDSLVVVGIIDNMVTHSFVSLYTEIESIKMVIGSNKITADKDLFKATWKKWQHNDGNYGGMVKLIDPNDTDAGILSRVNKIEAALSTHISLYNSHTHPVSGAATSAPASIDGQTSSQTQRAQLENKDVTH